MTTDHLTPESFAAVVDHTLLKPEATEHDITELTHEGIRLGVAAVCVNPIWVPTVSALLSGTKVKTCSVIGFPLGASTTQVVAAQAQSAIGAGAQEIDMVVPLGWVKSGLWSQVEQHLQAIRQATQNALLKVIVESAALTKEEIVRVAHMSCDIGADYVKTSTGFHPSGGASLEAVKLLKATIPQGVGVKASGGIRTIDQAKAMLEAGATRLGLSATATIIEQLQ